jgi:predicted Zn-dependent protease
MKLLLVTILSLSGCGTALDQRALLEPTRVDFVLISAVEEFMAGCNEHVNRNRCLNSFNKIVSITAVDGYVTPNTGYVGICERKTLVDLRGVEITSRLEIKVMVSKGGVNLTGDQIRQTVMHELGHCVLRLDHRESVELMAASNDWLTDEEMLGFDVLKGELWDMANE